MSRTIHCAKLDIDAEGLDFAPWPGPLGQRIYAEISKPAWQQWLAHQTTLINEYRLNPLDPKARKIPRRRNGEIPVRRRLCQGFRLHRPGQSVLTKCRAFGLMRGSTHHRRHQRLSLFARFPAG